MGHDRSECGMQLVFAPVEVVRNIVKHTGYQSVGIYPQPCKNAYCSCHMLAERFSGRE